MGSLCVHSQDPDPDYSTISKNIEEFDLNFELGPPLGFGEFSEVKIASSQTSQIAVKCIQLSKIRNSLHLLKREIGIMLKIKHKNVIEFLDVYESIDYVYITMELCPDGNLKQRVKKSGTLSTQTMKTITFKLLDALVYLHNNHICHRDIKPENILFKGEEPKLADFGLARMMNGTSNFSMVGTPYYLAPEVISGDYNTKCDIWSLGIVVYFALTGKKPFEATDRDELFEKIIDDEIMWEGIEDDCQDFLRYLLRKDHKIRPSAVEALDHRWLK